MSVHVREKYGVEHTSFFPSLLSCASRSVSICEVSRLKTRASFFPHAFGAGNMMNAPHIRNLPLTLTTHAGF